MNWTFKPHLYLIFSFYLSIVLLSWISGQQNLLTGILVVLFYLYSVFLMCKGVHFLYSKWKKEEGWKIEFILGILAILVFSVPMTLLIVYVATAPGNFFIHILDYFKNTLPPDDEGYLLILLGFNTYTPLGIYSIYKGIRGFFEGRKESVSKKFVILLTLAGIIFALIGLPALFYSSYVLFS